MSLSFVERTRFRGLVRFGTFRELTVNQMLHPVRSVIQSVEKRSPNGYRRRSEAERLEDVGAPPDAAVNEDFELVEDFRAAFVKLQEHEDRRWESVQVSAPVIAIRTIRFCL